VHEGVEICLRDLTSVPRPSKEAQVDALDALVQFVFDSEDECAAASLAFPVLARHIEGVEPEVRSRVLRTTRDIVDELLSRGKGVDVASETLDAVRKSVSRPTMMRG
jgi:hypothetical protein